MTWYAACVSMRLVALIIVLQEDGVKCSWFENESMGMVFEDGCIYVRQHSALASTRAERSLVWVDPLHGE